MLLDDLEASERLECLLLEGDETAPGASPGKPVRATPRRDPLVGRCWCITLRQAHRDRADIRQDRRRLVHIAWQSLEVNSHARPVSPESYKRDLRDLPLTTRVHDAFGRSRQL